MAAANGNGNFIRWRAGEGWIVLSGGGDSGMDSTVDVMDVESLALSRIRYGEPVAYIWAAGDLDTADKHLEALEDMGAPTGYLVDVLTEDDDTIHEQLREAGMIVLGDGPNTEALRSAMKGAAASAMMEAYARGGVILGVGSGAAVLGSLLPRGAEGLGMVEGAIIVPHFDDEYDQGVLAEAVRFNPHNYGLGISEGSALALGPEGRVEAWGARKVTVAFGPERADG